jgi:type II secretory pathway predicted ATPase ExeA
MLDSTLTFFGLTNPAFSRPPREPYLDPARKNALGQLQRLVERRGFAVLTGASGSGKTALLHYLRDSLNENQHQIAYVPFSFLEKGQMLHYLAGQLGLEPRRGIAAALCVLQKHLHSIQPVTPLIILDEVEQLETHTAGLLRSLLHDRADTAHHCALIMAGAGSFVDQKLRLEVHEALRQRITLYLRLPPLSREHCEAYIGHHLRSAGCTNEIFEPPALELIHELVNGRLRLINTLAEAAMDHAAENRDQTIGLEHIEAVAETVLPPQIAQVTP